MLFVGVVKLCMITVGVRGVSRSLHGTEDVCSTAVHALSLLVQITAS
jgi:hypothetical protein